jgi:hypothetical protein
VGQGGQWLERRADGQGPGVSGKKDTDLGLGLVGPWAPSRTGLDGFPSAIYFFPISFSFSLF